MVRALILASLAMLLLAAQAQPVGNNASGQGAAAEGNESAPKNANVAAPSRRPSGDPVARDANEQTEKAEQTQRERRDVSAQEDMAYWAGAMFWAAFAQAVFSAVGIVLIYVTFREARRAADSGDKMAAEAASATAAAVEASKAGQEANRLTRNAQIEARSRERSEARKAQRRQERADRETEAALAIAARNADAAARHVEVALQTSDTQLRPWLKVDIKEEICKRLSETENRCALILVISNAGVSPAFNTGISVSVRVVWSEEPLGPIDLPVHLGQFAPIFPNEPMDYSTSFQPTLTEIRAITDRAIAARTGMPIVVFDLKISYRAASSDKVRETAFRYVSYGTPGDVEWLVRDREIGDDVTPRMGARMQPQDIMT